MRYWKARTQLFSVKNTDGQSVHENQVTRNLEQFSHYGVPIILSLLLSWHLSFLTFSRLFPHELLGKIISSTRVSILIGFDGIPPAVIHLDIPDFAHIILNICIQPMEYSTELHQWSTSVVIATQKIKGSKTTPRVIDPSNTISESVKFCDR